MGSNLQEASEVVTGLIMTSKLSPNVVRTELLFPPYNDIVKYIKEGNNEPEGIILKFGIGAINPALDSVKNLNGLSEAYWLSILEKKPPNLLPFNRINWGLEIDTPALNDSFSAQRCPSWLPFNVRLSSQF